MEYKGVEWLDDDFDQDMKDRIYGYLLRDAYSEQSELELENINTELAEYDEIEENYGHPDITAFQIRVSEVVEAKSTPYDDLFLTRSLDNPYLVEIPQRWQDSDSYIVGTGQPSTRSRITLPEASLVGSINCKELLES